MSPRAVTGALSSIATFTALASAQVSVQPAVPTTAYRAPHIAVGMFAVGEFGPALVEATRDGWVYLSFLEHGVEPGSKPPNDQIILDARDVRRWTGITRERLRHPAPLREESSGRPAAGRGRNHLYFFTGTATNPDYLITWGCDDSHPGSESANAAQAASFLDLLDSAAAIAGTREPRAPTLSRPYAANELSCPAKLQVGNVVPTLPAGHALEEVGVGFVVDTAGRVEKGSLRFLPETDRDAAAAVSAAVSRWTFDPAEWDGTPVRQFVQIAINLDTIPLRTGAGISHPIDPHATNDGWVRIDVGGDGAKRVHEWFQPDSINSWVARIAAAHDSMRDPSPQHRWNWVASLGSVFTSASTAGPRTSCASLCFRRARAEEAATRRR